MHAVILMFELYFHLFSSFQDPNAIKCNPRFQSLRALANPWAVGHPLIPSYTCPLMWAPSYIYPLMPSYTYLLINPLTHTLLCMCIFSIGLQNHWAPSYTYPLIQSYVYVFFFACKPLGSLLLHLPQLSLGVFLLLQVHIWVIMYIV